MHARTRVLERLNSHAVMLSISTFNCDTQTLLSLFPVLRSKLTRGFNRTLTPAIKLNLDSTVTPTSSQDPNPGPNPCAIQQVKLKSKPFTDGNVILELQTSCIGGKQLQKRKQGDDDFYFCTDGANPSDETKPLASFKVGTKNLYVTTLPFSKTDWDTYKTLEMFVNHMDI